MPKKKEDTPVLVQVATLQMQILTPAARVEVMRNYCSSCGHERGDISLTIIPLCAPCLTRVWGRL